jgi:hypothetical protein
MYKVLHQPSGQEITILDPRWREQIDYLRTLDKRDVLVCTGCKQPVRVRAGKVKRWHFAHKHLQNCPFERESPTLLKTRAVLYNWLVNKFGPDAVTIEKRLHPPVFPRHVDCWVEKGGLAFAYWIFDRRLPPDERDNLKSGFGNTDVRVNWVFVTDLMRVDQEFMQDRLHLTTTERAFMQESAFDQAWQTHFEYLGMSLHYLDADQENLITYRNLSVIHMPQLYAGTRLEHSLAELLASTSTGEFIHPGEVQQLQQRRQEIERQEQQAEQRLRKAREFFGQKPQSKSASSVVEKQTPRTQPFERAGICRICGTETADWVTYYGPTKECICRDCKDQVSK